MPQLTIRPRDSILNPLLQRPSALDSKPRNTNYLWLDKNENLDQELQKILSSILLHLPHHSLSTYPEAGEAYRKLAEWLVVGADQLLLTPGSDGAIRLVFEAFINSGDAVLHTSPTFAMYPIYSKMFGASVQFLEYLKSDNGPFLDPEIIMNAVKEYKPKLICLPNPDSPTGTTQDPDVLYQILSLCEKMGTVLLLDEAYHPFYDWSAVQWTKESRNLIIARTFAKAWGAAGLRVGYAVAHPDTIALLHKMRPMYEVSTIGVEFISRLIDKKSEMLKSVARINEGKSFFRDEMQSIGFNVLSTAGNFLHVDFGEQAHCVHAALLSKVYYRIGFDSPSLAGFSRFSMAPRCVMERVSDMIKDAVLGIRS